MIKKLITFIFYLFFLTCGDSQDSIVGGDDGGGSDGGSPITDCTGYPLNPDCPIDESVDGILGCAYYEDYCSPPICVGGTSDFSENIAYCDCNGDYIPGIEPLNILGDCSDPSNPGCGQVDGCGVCYGGTSGNLEYNDCDCNGDVVPEDCSNPLTEGCAVNEVCGCISGNTGIESCNECFDNFSISPQSTLQETICVPEDFVYYVTPPQAGYLIQDIIIPEDLMIELETENCNQYNDCDWVAAFNPNNDICVGATILDLSSCGGGVCSINVMGVFGDLNQYMLEGITPAFQIYDASENQYYYTTVLGNSPWESGQIFTGIILTIIP